MYIKINDEGEKTLVGPYSTERAACVGESLTINSTDRREVVRISTSVESVRGQVKDVVVLHTKSIGGKEGVAAAHGTRELREG